MQTQPRISRILLLGLILAFAQLCLALAVHGGRPANAYKALFQWDSVHYREIAQNGYFSHVGRDENIDAIDEEKFNHMTNVAFFPGYPLAGRLLWKLTGLPMPTVMLLTAQIFAAAFWTYLLLLLRAFAVARRVRVAAAALVFAHPGAFFLITAYSESVFLTMLLGYVFWSNRKTKTAWMIAAAHGFWMSLTRTHGLFAAAYPLLRDGRRIRWKAIAVTCVAAFGIAAFFAYSQWAFSHWDLYMQRQWRGWGIQPEYLFFLRGKLHILPLNQQGLLHPNNVSPAMTSLTLAVFAVTPVVEWIRRRRGDRDGWETRVPLYATAFLLWYFYAAGLATNDMRSLLRYLLAPHALMVVAYAHLLSRMPRQSPIIRAVGYGIALVAITGSLALQARFIGTFMDGAWVAGILPSNPWI